MSPTQEGQGQPGFFSVVFVGCDTGPCDSAPGSGFLVPRAGPGSRPAAEPATDQTEGSRVRGTPRPRSLHGSQEKGTEFGIYSRHRKCPDSDLCPHGWSLLPLVPPQALQGPRLQHSGRGGKQGSA